MNWSCRWFVLAAMAAAWTTANARAAVTYMVTDLGTFEGTYALGNALNNHGQVTGLAATTGDLEEHAFLYSRGVMTDLGTLGSSYSEGTGINLSGTVVGNSNLPNGDTHAFVRTAGALTDLGTLGGTASYAAGINNSGQIAGTSTLASGAERATLFFNGVKTNLGTLPGGAYSSAAAINATGQITGTSANAVGAERAYRYSGGTMSPLGTLGGTNSYGIAINDNGYITGSSDKSGDLVEHAFLYNGVSMQDLGTLGGGFSYGYGINASAHVVGYSFLPLDTARHAFIYKNGTMTDLNSAIRSGTLWVLEEANAINDLGQITGTGLYDGDQRAYLLTPSHTATFTIPNNDASLPTTQTARPYTQASRTYSGTLDLAQNYLIVDSGTLADVTDMIRAGTGGTAVMNWTGNGLTTHSAASGALAGKTGLGVIRNVVNPKLAFNATTNPARLTSFDSETLTGNEILTKYTWYGDLDLDGVVTSLDFALLDAGFAGATQQDGFAGWFFGDVNYDGVVNSFDYSLASAGYQAFLAGGGVPLPEPSTLALAVVGLLVVTSGTYRRPRRSANRVTNPRPNTTRNAEFRA